jgi:hypothetical protein
MLNKLIDGNPPSGMKRIHITGKMVITFRQHLDVPVDEVEELLSSVDNITCNVDLDRASWEVEEWEEIHTLVREVPKGYLG